MSKKELTKYQKITIVIGIVGLIIGIGALLGTQLNFEFTEDDDPVTIPTHTPTNGGTTPPPVYTKPELLLESATIITSEDSADFQISAKNPENVVLIAIHFYVDGVEDSYSLILNNPVSGIFKTTVYKSQLTDCLPTSVVTSYLLMSYISESGGVVVERIDDVIQFSFVETEPDPEDYYPPEYIVGSFEFSHEDTILTFGFSMTYNNLINNIQCYFVVDDVSLKTESGNVFYVEMAQISDGFYKASFDFSVLPSNIEVYFYLSVDYINAEGEDDTYVVPKINYLIIGSDTNGIGLNYIFVLITTFAVFTFLTINKIKKVKNNGRQI